MSGSIGVVSDVRLAENGRVLAPGQRWVFGPQQGGRSRMADEIILKGTSTKVRQEQHTIARCCFRCDVRNKSPPIFTFFVVLGVVETEPLRSNQGHGEEGDDLCWPWQGPEANGDQHDDCGQGHDEVPEDEDRPYQCDERTKSKRNSSPTDQQRVAPIEKGVSRLPALSSPSNDRREGAGPVD